MDEALPNAAAAALVDVGLGPFDGVDALPENPPRVDRRTRSGSRPTGENNPFGAWALRADIAGAASGPLAGRTVAIKDCFAVSGLPLTVGTIMLEGHVAKRDATVVARSLEAGGTILGTVVCEALLLSGGSHTSAAGGPQFPTTGGARPAGRPPGVPPCWPPVP
jgi:amidase